MKNSEPLLIVFLFHKCLAKHRIIGHQDSPQSMLQKQNFEILLWVIIINHQLQFFFFFFLGKALLTVTFLLHFLYIEKYINENTIYRRERSASNATISYFTY